MNGCKSLWRTTGLNAKRVHIYAIWFLYSKTLICKMFLNIELKIWFSVLFTGLRPILYFEIKYVDEVNGKEFKVKTNQKRTLTAFIENVI